MRCRPVGAATAPSQDQESLPLGLLKMQAHPLVSRRLRHVRYRRPRLPQRPPIQGTHQAGRHRKSRRTHQSCQHKTTTFTASRALESVKRGELISASDRRGVACLIKKRHSELVLILALCGLFKGVSAKGVSATRLVRGTLGKQRFIVAPRRRVSATDALSGPSLSPSLCATSMSIDPLLVPVMPVVGRPLASGYLQGQYHAHTRQHHAIP